MDNDVVPPESLSLPAKTGDTSATAKAVDGFIGNVGPSQSFASLVVYISSHTGNADDRPLVPRQAPTTPNVPGNAADSPLVTTVTLPAKAMSLAVRALRC